MFSCDATIGYINANSYLICEKFYTTCTLENIYKDKKISDEKQTILDMIRFQSYYITSKKHGVRW